MDGRKKTESISVFKSTPIRESARRRIIENFLECGSTTHSKNAETLAYVIQYCLDTETPFVLKAVPGMGFTIENTVDMETKCFMESLDEGDFEFLLNK